MEIIGTLVGGASMFVLVGAVGGATVVASRLDFGRVRTATHAPAARASVTVAVESPVTPAANGRLPDGATRQETQLELESTPPTPPTPPIVTPSPPTDRVESTRRPTAAELLVADGDKRLHGGDLPAAKRSYELALEKSPAFIPARIGVAEAEWRMGRRREARERYRSILNDAPGIAPAVVRDRASTELEQ